jgi:regulator of nonsense transcripts 1
MYERFINRNVTRSQLDIQYRMHPAISAFPSRYFYGGTICDGVTALDRAPPAGAFPFPNPVMPICFINVMGTDVQEGTSHQNSDEAAIVARVLEYLHRKGVAVADMGVIAPYAAQETLIKSQLEGHFGDVKIATVESYQGSERRFIIMSAVRSDGAGYGVGFLRDPRRLNVALTRAQSGLILIGNADFLSTDSEMWGDLIAHFRDVDAIIEPGHIFDPPDQQTEPPPIAEGQVNTPEANTPETNAPETNTPETNTPEVNDPETKTPEVNDPEANRPKRTRTRRPRPEANRPKRARTARPRPKANSLEPNTPEVNRPQVITPEVWTPEVDEPKVSTPEVSRLVPLRLGPPVVPPPAPSVPSRDQDQSLPNQEIQSIWFRLVGDS